MKNFIHLSRHFRKSREVGYFLRARESLKTSIGRLRKYPASRLHFICIGAHPKYLIKLRSFIWPLFALVGFSEKACLAESAPQAEMIVPSVDQVMDESGVDTLKKMIRCFENEIALNKSKNIKASFPFDVKYGIMCHNLAFYGAKTGNRGFAAKCYELFRSDLADPTYPDSLKPIAAAYEGSSRALMGDEDANPVNKVKFTNEGIAILNEAVDQYGKKSFLPRFMRANVCFSVPEFFKKEKTSLADYKYLEDCYLSGPAKPDNGIMAFVYLNRGNFYKKDRDMKMAMEYWKKSVSIAPSSGAAKAASKLIALFSE